MKLKKPTVTVPQTELESYVASMLVEHSTIDNGELLEQDTSREESVEKGLARNSSPTDTQTAKHKKNQDQNPSIRLIISKQQNKLLSPKKPDHTTLDDVASVIKQSISEEQPAKSINLLSSKNIKAIGQKTKNPIVGHKTDNTSSPEFAEAEEIEKDPRLKNVEKLLSQIALTKIPQPSAQNLSQLDTQVASCNEQNKPTEVNEITENQQLVAAMESSFEHRENTPLKEELGSVFQTLVFEVNQLPMAVPLVKLGGIVDLAGQEITPLVGTPDWFLGLVPNERGNLLVVDTQRFLMPEREQADQPDYRFLIVLDNSQWAIACHSVDDAKNLSPDDIRWSSRNSQRPWFAGMVVEYMSALIEVDELINMLADNIVE